MEKETLTAAELKSMVFGDSDDGENSKADLKKEIEDFPSELSKKTEEISQPVFDSENPTPTPV